MSAPDPDRPDNPYVGPRSLGARNHLFGRDTETAELRGLLITKRIVLMYSPSGAGKTSLLEAGLRRELEARRFVVMPTVRISLGTGLPDRLQNLDRYTASAVLSLEQGDADVLTSAPVSSLRDYVHGRSDDDHDRCLFFDQFEELFTLDAADHSEKERFLAQLTDLLADDRTWAVLSMREDYIAQLDPYLVAFPHRLGTRFRLGYLSLPKAALAVGKPAERAGVTFAEDAIEKLTTDLSRVRVERRGQPADVEGTYVEPVQLQVTCQQLWNARRHPKRIDAADLDAVGTVDDALAQFYATQVSSVAAASGVSERSIRQWFGEKLITNHGYRGQAIEGPDPAHRGVVRLLEDAYLIRVEQRRGIGWFELSHDRLVAPVVADNARWFEDHLSTLQRAATAWFANGRRNGPLLTMLELDEAEKWAETASEGELDDIDREYLEVCRQRRAVERQEVESKRRDLERARRRSRNQWRALAGAAVIIAIIVGLLVWSLDARNRSDASGRRATAAADAARRATAEAEAARDESDASLLVAETARLAAEARELIARSGTEADPYAAALLALEAEQRTQPALAEARASWAKAAQSLAQQGVEIVRKRLAPDGAKTAVAAWSPMADHLATGGDTGSVYIFSADASTFVGPLPGGTDQTLFLAWNADGTLLAALNADGSIHLWTAAGVPIALDDSAPTAPACGRCSN